MKKRISAIMLIIALAAVILTSCSGDNGEEVDTTIYSDIDAETDNRHIQEPQEAGLVSPDLFELPAISIVPDVKQGVTKAETETSDYEFYGRTEEENIKLAQINEIASFVLKHEYGYSPPKGRIIHFIGEQGIRVNEFSVDDVQQIVASNGRTVINTDFIWSVGALFYGSSRNLLPAWLAAGLELFWSDRFGIERFAFDKEFDVKAWQAEIADFPALDDTWFAQYVEDTERLSAAFSFVKWLDENGLLDETVRTYLSDKQDEGDLLFADAWQKFTGYDIRGNFFFENRFRYLYGIYIKNHYGDWDYYFYSVLTEHGHYFIDGYPEMPSKEFINDIDTQYAYAKQWLGFEDVAPIPTRIPFYRSGTAVGGAEYVSLPGGNSLAPVHEAFHYLLAVNNINPDFLWLWEGLPEAIGFIYGDENPDSSYAQGMYYNLTGKSDYNSTFDFKHHAHLMALDAVNYFIENDIYGTYIRADGQLGFNPKDKPSAFPQGYLNTYPTAASFVIYMLEIGSKEDFMRLYTDISAAEELYGKDFNALYGQWLEFLKQI